MHIVNAKLYSTLGSNSAQSQPRCPPPTIIMTTRPYGECRRPTTAAAECRLITKRCLPEFTLDTGLRHNYIVEMRLQSDHCSYSPCCLQSRGRSISFLRVITRPYIHTLLITYECSINDLSIGSTDVYARLSTFNEGLASFRSAAHFTTHLM
jgi:hypothetical protein